MARHAPTVVTAQDDGIEGHQRNRKDACMKTLNQMLTRPKRVGQCQMMVPTMPKVGDLNRNPEPHQCKNQVYADGFCAVHSEKRRQELIAWAIEKNHRRASKEQEIDPIGAAIVLLVQSGYRVERIAE